MHEHQFFYTQQFHRKMGKVNKRKISRGGKFNSVIVNALQPMQSTGVISVVQPNSNLNNSVASTNSLTSVNHQTNNSSSANLASSNLLNASPPTTSPLMSLTSQQTSLNLSQTSLSQSNQAPQTAANQLISTQLSNAQLQNQQTSNNTNSVHPTLQSTSNHPLLELQQMNTLTSVNCNQANLPDLTNQQTSLVNNGAHFTNVNNVNLNNLNQSNMNSINNSIQPQHNSKCARLDTTEMNWDLKPNLIKIENDLNSNSPNSNSSNNHSHNSTSSIDSPANCLMKNNCDLNVKLTGGYSSKSRNGKYELKILKQPEEQHR